MEENGEQVANTNPHSRVSRPRYVGAETLLAPLPVSHEKDAAVAYNAVLSLLVLCPSFRMTRLSS